MSAVIWTEIGGIPSETSKNTRYAISVNTEGDLGCRCMSWLHSTEMPKVCKHVRSTEAGKLLAAWREKQKPKLRDRVAGLSGVALHWDDRKLLNNHTTVRLNELLQACHDLLATSYEYGGPRSKFRLACNNLGVDGT